MAKAKKRGDFQTLTLSQASVRSTKSRKMTDAAKLSISRAVKSLFQRRPELHPNRKVANNRSKMTYPERLAYNWLTIAGIDFEHNAKIDKYYVDFLVGTTAIEIDGKRWHDKVYDATRDGVINSLGYSVIRLDAADVVKDKDNLLLKQAVNGAVDAEALAEFRRNRVSPKTVCDCGCTKYKKAIRCKACHAIWRKSNTLRSVG